MSVPIKVPQFAPYLDERDYRAIKRCFDLNWITEGPQSKEFVEQLLKLTGSKYGVLAPNGTLSIYLALRAAGIGPGDEVIVPNFSFIATANAVEMCGARPVFVDVRENLHLDVSQCASALTSNTKAILPVHIYGMACDMDEVMEFAKRHRLLVVEDAAQGIGIKWKGRHTGTFGHLGSFSFFADKTITTGEGGLVVTDDEKLFEKLLYLRNQGRLNRGSFVHPEIGYNFRMTDIQSAVGLAQLQKLPEIIEKKQHILEKYKSCLKKSVHILLPEGASNHIPFRVCLIVAGGSMKLMDHMKSRGIETRTFFYPLHRQPCFKNFQKQDDSCFRVSIRVYEEGVCLPSFVGITDEQIEYVCGCINEFL